MPHQSENARRLKVRTTCPSERCNFPTADPGAAEAWLFILPFAPTLGWAETLRTFAGTLNEHSVVAVLTYPADGADVCQAVEGLLQFQLWIAAKLDRPLARRRGQLPAHHAALLVFSRYRSPLRHTKTRVGYTYCPACEKTTKDYGGKKHTYHPYGTLVSDVWRDIAYTPGELPKQIIERLADLFGLEPYRELRVVDLTSLPAKLPRKTKSRAAAEDSSVRPPTSRLICGDVLNELPKIASNSIDFAFADPPYNLAKRYDAWDDAIGVAGYLRWCDRWIGELARVLKPGRTCAVLNIPLWSVRHFQQMRRRLDFQCWIAWEGLSLPVRMIMPAHYGIVCFSKGPARALPGLALTALREDYCLRTSCVRARSGDRQPITDVWWDIHRLKHNARRVDHPCQLPPALMRRLIGLFTREDEVVLDPFNGAGTTTLCAAGLRRRYIGIELSPRYHRLADARHETLRLGGDPFEKSDRVPTSKNSRVGRAGRGGGIRYDVPKKTLQLEVRRVSQLLDGRLPTRGEMVRHGRYAIRYYDEYFSSWGEACAAARASGMSEHKPPGVLAEIA